MCLAACLVLCSSGVHCALFAFVTAGCQRPQRPAASVWAAAEGYCWLVQYTHVRTYTISSILTWLRCTYVRMCVPHMMHYVRMCIACVPPLYIIFSNLLLSPLLLHSVSFPTLHPLSPPPSSPCCSPGGLPN